MIVVMVYLLFGMTHSVSGMAIWNLGRYMLCRWWQSAEDKVRSETSRDVYLQCDILIFLPVCCRSLLPIILLQLSLPAKIIICQTQTCLWHRLLRQIEWKYTFEKSCLDMYRKDFVQPHLGSWWVDWGCDWQQWLRASYFLRFLWLQQNKCIYQYDNDWKYVILNAVKVETFPPVFGTSFNESFHFALSGYLGEDHCQQLEPYFLRVLFAKHQRNIYVLQCFLINC